MAITISQQPTYPNVTYTDLVYVVQSTETAQPQFQYVMDIVSGSTIVSRVRQYPNPASAGVFNPNRILNDYLEYPTQFDLTGATTTSNTQVGTFNIKFGEEYGTSISSSVTLYNGAGSPGNPSVTGTTAKVFPGVIEPNNGISYNWLDSGSLVRMSDRPDTIGVDLSYDDIYFTVYNGTAAPEAIRQRFYDENGTLLGTDLFNQPASTFYTHKVGYSTIPANAAYLTLELDGTIYTYPMADTCYYDRANFAFINNYGFWDMYGINLPKKRNTTIERRQLTKPFVDYSSSTSTYDVTRRGKQIFNTSLKDSYSISTPWLTKVEADWVSQMFESPEVYLQLTGGNPTVNKWAPINITQTNWVHNTNPRSQKQFQYEIQYEFSNQRRGR